jgi:hypothetical protein
LGGFSLASNPDTREQMASIDFKFRKKAVRTLTTKVGVYVLCDLDKTPIYIGKTRDGIRRRVARHLTSARSDIIANRQIDVWEIAFVQTYPVARKYITELESRLFHHFNQISPLMNGAQPPLYRGKQKLPTPTQEVQVMPDAEIEDKKEPSQRLPRQAAHYAQLVGHFLTVKNSAHIARAMNAHFDRLKKYHRKLLKLAIQQPGDTEDA